MDLDPLSASPHVGVLAKMYASLLAGYRQHEAVDAATEVLAACRILATALYGAAVAEHPDWPMPQAHYLHGQVTRAIHDYLEALPFPSGDDVQDGA